MESSNIQLIFKGNEYFKIDKVEIGYKVLWYDSKWEKVTIKKIKPEILTNGKYRNFKRLTELKLKD